MSRAMFVVGFKGEIPKDRGKHEAEGIDLSFGRGKGGVTDTADEPEAIGCVVIEIAKLDPAIRFVRVYCR